MEWSNLVVPFVEQSLDFVARTAPFFGKGVLATLAEFAKTRRQHATWVHDFVTAFSSRLPTKVRASDYMEAYLHCSHFPLIDEKDHVPGCMPLHMYAGTEAAKRGFVPLERYVYETLTDLSSTRSSDEAWISYAFSALLMKRLETDRRLPIVRRGLDHALGANTQAAYAEQFGEHVLPGLLYDEKTAHRHINEICSAIKRLGWPTYFHTQTCNMQNFPGVADVYDSIRDLGHDVRHYEAYIVRRWHRAAHLFMQWLLHGTDHPLGEVRHMWCRHEFQTDVGNLSHLHMLLWTEENLARENDAQYFQDASAAVARLSADVRTAFDYVADPERKADLIALADKIQHHRCTPKCLNAEGRCRFHYPQPLHDDNLYTPFSTTVPDDIRHLLIQCGLATEDATTGDVTLHRLLLGGTHKPARGTGNSTTSPFSGRILDATGSHSNTQVVDTRFVIAYLVKYAAGEEERLVVQVKQTTPDSATVRLTDENLRKRRKPNEPGDGHCISSPEMTMHSLGCATVSSTFDTVHVSTAPPEYRYHTLKGKHAPPLSERGPLFGITDELPEGQAVFRCGPDPEDPSRPRAPRREPSADQICAHRRQGASRFHPDSVTVFALRPPELLDLSIDEYFELCVVLKADHRPLPPESVFNWRHTGLRDLRGRRVLLHPDLFGPPYRHLADSVFRYRLQEHRPLDLLTRYVQFGTHRCSWFSNVLAEGYQSRVVVTPRVSPADGHQWLCHSLLTSGPFEDEQTLLGSQTADQLMESLGILDDPLTTLRRFILDDLVYWPVTQRKLWNVIRSSWAHLSKLKAGTAAHVCMICLA